MAFRNIQESVSTKSQDFLRFGATESEKFWKLDKRIKEGKHHPGVVMEMRKSETIWDIVHLIRLRVITYDDLLDFGNELQQEVKRILEMSR